MNEKIYISKTDYLNMSEEPDIMNHLPVYRIEKIKRLKNERARNESMAAGLLLVKALSSYTGKTETEMLEYLNAKEHDADKRCLKINAGEIYYSITHSGGYVAVAVAKCPVGVDVEVKDDKDFKVTRRMMAEEDKEYILHPMLSEEKRQIHFRDIWTIKESFLKCTGEGISVPLNSFSVKLHGALMVYGGRMVNSSGVLWKIVSLGYPLGNKNYYVGTTRLENEKYSLSICSSNSNLTLDIQTVEVLL